MKKWFVFSFLVFCCHVSFSQDVPFRKNTVAFESGIFNRGLLGISYSRNFAKTNYAFFSSDCYAGVGYTFNHYLGLGSGINLGREEVFLFVGADVKYYYVTLPDIIFSVDHVKGISYAPLMGLSVYTVAGLTAKGRFGFMFGYKNGAADFLFPVMGFSIGKSF